jgi:VCBS repeat-containing protein
MAAIVDEKAASSTFSISDKIVSAHMGVRKPVMETVFERNVAMMPPTEEATTPMPFSISGGASGEATFLFIGPLIGAYCDALNLEIRVNDINIGALAGGQTLLAGVPKVGSLHPIGDNLVAGTAMLPAGDYTVLLRRAWSSDGSRIDANGDGLSVAELGEAGIVLNLKNSVRVLDEVETALGPILGQTVRRVLEMPLNTATAVEGRQLEALVTTALENFGLAGSRQTVLDAIAKALMEDVCAEFCETPITVTTRGHAYLPETIHGNVFDEQSGSLQEMERGGETCTIMPGVAVTHVWSKAGAPVEVTDGVAQIAGDHGTLTIKADGSYAYTPKGSIQSLGQMEHFGYAIADGPETKKAELGITLDGGLAASDIAHAGIEYQHAQTPGERIKDAIDYQWTGVSNRRAAAPAGNLTSERIVVEPNTMQDLTITVNADNALMMGAGLAVHLEVWKGTDWASHAWLSNGQLANFLGHGFPAQIIIPDVPAGDYRVRIEPRFDHAYAEGRINVDVDTTVTHLDQVEVSSVFPARGNVFDNDLRGEKGEVRCALAGDGKTCGTSIITGRYGLLVLEADGDYTFTPNSRVGFGSSTETFTYQVAHGEVSEESVLRIEISGTLEADPHAVGSGDIVLVDTVVRGVRLPEYDLLTLHAQETGDVAPVRAEMEAAPALLTHPAPGIEQDLDHAATTAIV